MVVGSRVWNLFLVDMYVSPPPSVLDTRDVMTLWVFLGFSHEFSLYEMFGDILPACWCPAFWACRFGVSGCMVGVGGGLSVGLWDSVPCPWFRFLFLVFCM